tara:strand:- start:109 stop:639 length:531 start_codon:yes stop_codon:yes gene_type:complete
MIFIEDKNFLNKEQKLFINSFFKKQPFAFYYQEDSVEGDNRSVLIHHLISRKKYRDNLPYKMSDFTDSFVDIFNAFMKNNKLEYNEIHRMAVNFSYNNGQRKGQVHTDHEYPHKQVLICLNEPLDLDCGTVILDQKNKVVREVKFEQYKGFMFESTPHYQLYPRKGIRIMLVTTYV